MCGRFHLDSAPERIRAHYGLAPSRMAAEAILDGEIFPGTSPLVVTRSGDGEPAMQPMFWGFTPFRSHGRRKQPINARGEKLFASGYWRPAARKRRCLIPLNSWDEWQKQGDGSRQRWRLAPKIDAELFSLGGVFTTYEHDNGATQTGFAVITQPAGSALDAIHHRQPLIVMPRDYQRWLNPDSARADVEHIIQRQGRNYEAHPV